jgi:hypothetical protein
MKTGDEMKVQIEQVGRKGVPYRGSVNGVEFTSLAGFCWLVALMATESDGCISGLGTPNGGGYCQASWRERMHAQHALIRAWREGLDQPPTGFDAAHGPCHHRWCVNPLHVEFKTSRDNAADKRRDGTYNGGERGSAAKLTNTEAAAIRALYATGTVTYRELGHRYGVSGRRIGAIVRHETYAPLEAAT